jgi:tRNA A-37 threonylcarbamoyl transferase component Bud32
MTSTNDIEGNDGIESPFFDAALLCAAGRRPPLPLRVRLRGDDNANTGIVTLTRVLRVLPGKRMVGAARYNDQTVLAKLFIGRKSARDWQREYDGIVALQAAGISTPALLQGSELAGGGHVLLTRFLEPAENLAELWQACRDAPETALALLTEALNTLGRMHEAGLVQQDLHLGNFLRHHGTLYVIDGDAVRVLTPGRPLPDAQATRNLAILLAQLPATWDPRHAELLAAYRAGRTSAWQATGLAHELARVRAWRVKSFMAKTIRDCSRFAVRQDSSHFTATVRSHARMLAPLLTDPDRAFDGAELLKNGRTSTVARIVHDDTTLVIKRYNLKNPAHALSRLWRPSRAWHAWQQGHRLAFLDIATPAPLALIEARLGPLRRRAWLITENCPGPNLRDHLAQGAPPPTAEARAILAFFEALQRERISHGDLKATNLLWHDQRIVAIDLDAMTAHRAQASYERAWRRDRARLLRNWPADCALHRWLDEHLPAAR